jgi:hypothetical protein
MDDIFEALNGFENFRDEGSFFNSGVLGVQNMSICDNCFGQSFDVDEVRGDLVCVGCGCAMGGISYAAPDRQAWNDFEDAGAPLAQENARDVAFSSVGVSQKRRAKKNTYKRSTYHRERLSQWFMSEPTITSGDWKTIEKQFRKFTGNTFRIPSAVERRAAEGSHLPGTYSLSKQEIRCMLRACDTVTEHKRQEQLARWPDHPLYKLHREEVGKKHVSFVTRYLERWISIRHHFSGEGSTAKDCPDILFEQTIDMLNRMDHALHFCIDSGQRSSFPACNMMIRNIFQLHNALHLAKDFPELNTRRARKAADFYWWKFCKYFKWPYLLKEVKFLRNRNKTVLK